MGSRIMISLSLTALLVVLPSSLGRPEADHGYGPKCRTVYKTEYKTVYETSYKPKCSVTYSEACKTVYVTDYKTAYKEECSTTYTDQCYGDGYHKKCHKVPHQNCQEV